MKNILVSLAASLVISFTARAQQQARVPGGVKAHRDIAYVENGHERQKLDLFLPEKSGAALPLLIWIHGGGWQAGRMWCCFIPIRNRLFFKLLSNVPRPVVRCQPAGRG